MRFRAKIGVAGPVKQILFGMSFVVDMRAPRDRYGSGHDDQRARSSTSGDVTSIIGTTNAINDLCARCWFRFRGDCGIAPLTGRSRAEGFRGCWSTLASRAKVAKDCRQRCGALFSGSMLRCRSGRWRGHRRRWVLWRTLISRAGWTTRLKTLHCQSVKFDGNFFRAVRRTGVPDVVVAAWFDADSQQPPSCSPCSSSEHSQVRKSNGEAL